jgi:hypothetical protein
MESREQLEKRVAEIALGPDPARGEMRGHARGLIAIGDFATGLIAIGGISRGVVAFGGLAVGGVAIGGGAVGYYACSGGAAGAHVVASGRRDEEAQEFFREHGLAGLCSPR